MTYTFGQTSPQIFSEEEIPNHTIVLNIGQSLDDYVERSQLAADFQFTPAHIMSFTQRSWILAPDRANNAELILAVKPIPRIGKLILGAFVFGRPDKREQADNFKPSPYPGDEGRFIFLAEPALPEIWNKFVGNYLPASKPGEANPVRYYEHN